MTAGPKPLAVAVDGGGTRCRLALAGQGPRIVVETGPANVSTDFGAAVAQIALGLAELAARAGTEVDDLHQLPAFLGLAGVVGASIEERLRATLPFAHLRIADDRPAAVRGSLGDRDGFIAHCGTGSFHAAQESGRIRLSGGWGPRLGDEASAQWLARRALSETLKVADGRRIPAPLSQALSDRLGGPPGIVAFAGAATPSELGALAPMVTDHAEGGCALAREVMAEASADIVAALAALGWRPGQTLCLTGGLGGLYAPFLPPEMLSDLAPPSGSPIDGAVSLALEFAKDRGDD